MFGTGKPLEDSKQAIMSGIAVTIKQFNEKLSIEFGREIRELRAEMIAELKWQMDEFREELKDKHTRDVNKMREEFQNEYERAKQDLIDMRQEFMAELRTL